ncbi:DUF2835 domain-containing protein [Aliamphritea hakodatensis]|uniref:DUF2835 domain-containing protein n=1 Tax=Aliamphritea hakodatensis TaxID=2895352 RepID=UPI0022FD5889|nr:DUF2835 domain-containing protein [Aliamphritea hakodatensis]
MQQIIVDISLSSEEFLQHYRGTAKNVVARSRDGRRIRFPAEILRPFLLHSGISGSFVIRFDEGGKFSDIRRL